MREYEEAKPFRAAGFELTAVRMRALRPGDVRVPRHRRRAHARVLRRLGARPAPRDARRDADIFVCEATLAEPEPAERGHLTADEAVEAFRDSGARRLLVVHRPDELPLPAGIERAQDGYTTDV